MILFHSLFLLFSNCIFNYFLLCFFFLFFGLRLIVNVLPTSTFLLCAFTILLMFFSFSLCLSVCICLALYLLVCAFGPLSRLSKSLLDRYRHFPIFVTFPFDLWKRISNNAVICLRNRKFSIKILLWCSLPSFLSVSALSVWVHSRVYISPSFVVSDYRLLRRYILSLAILFSTQCCFNKCFRFMVSFARLLSHFILIFQTITLFRLFFLLFFLSIFLFLFSIFE